MKKTAGLVTTALLMSACAAPPAPTTASHPHVGIANPASVYCIQQGGKLRMEPTTHGAHAICILPSGQEVDEWAYYRQHHPSPQP